MSKRYLSGAVQYPYDARPKNAVSNGRMPPSTRSATGRCMVAHTSLYFFLRPMFDWTSAGATDMFPMTFRDPTSGLILNAS